MAKSVTLENSRLILPKVRLLFPSLFKTSVINGDDTGRYMATAVLDPKDAAHLEVMKKLRAFVKVGAEEHLKCKVSQLSNTFFRQLDNFDALADQGFWIAKCTNQSPPQVIGRNREKLSTDEGERLFGHSGVIANVMMQVWCSSKNGKNVSANLLAVQYVEEGEHLSGGGVSFDQAIESFDDLGDDPFDDDDGDDIFDDDSDFGDDDDEDDAF